MLSQIMKEEATGHSIPVNYASMNRNPLPSRHLSSRTFPRASDRVGRNSPRRNAGPVTQSSDNGFRKRRVPEIQRKILDYHCGPAACAAALLLPIIFDGFSSGRKSGVQLFRFRADVSQCFVYLQSTRRASNGCATVQRSFIVRATRQFEEELMRRRRLVDKLQSLFLVEID